MAEPKELQSNSLHQHLNVPFVNFFDFVEERLREDEPLLGHKYNGRDPVAVPVLELLGDVMLVVEVELVLVTAHETGEHLQLLLLDRLDVQHGVLSVDTVVLGVSQFYL